MHEANGPHGIPDEITLRLRFVADPHCRYGDDERGRARRLRAAVKCLRRSFGLVQYKRGPENPPEPSDCGGN